MTQIGLGELGQALGTDACWVEQPDLVRCLLGLALPVVVIIEQLLILLKLFDARRQLRQVSAAFLSRNRAHFLR